MADYFRNSYNYVWENTESIKNIILHQNVELANTVTFTIPSLICQASASTGFYTIAEMNTRTRVYKQEVINGVIQSTKTLVKDINGNDIDRISGATSFTARNDDVAYITGGSSGTLQLRSITPFSFDDKRKYTSFSEVFTTLSQIAHASSSFNNKEVTFVTDQLSEDEIANGRAFFYSIEVECVPDNADGMISYLQATHSGKYVQSALIGVITAGHYEQKCTVTSTKVNTSNVKVSTSFYCENRSSTAEGGPFLMKGEKYNAYQLFRKAMLTIDTQIIDNSITGLDEEYTADNKKSPNNIQYPIIVEPEIWESRLKSTQLYETVLECKNLWEIFQQIGKYLHAEPRLMFATDGTDRFVLSYKQLGKSDANTDTSQKITIYNSRSLNQFFASYDSYVTNLFSPQNLCREILTVSSSDGTCLIHTDNAELRCAYNINEIVEFNICYRGVWKDAMKSQVVNDNGDIVKLSSKIYEKSIFDILTSEYKVSPSKADSLYFTMGDNKIMNLTYVPPDDSNYKEQPMALKKIVRQLFGVSTDDLNFNDLMFEIVYRTQDTVRLTQIRPDMENFIKNSSYEKYPHHEQFYNQLDKIPDSERFSANMWGQLVRCGNAIIQCQEYCAIGDEKEEGDLYMIEGLPYYVVKAENEEYNDCILQKVTYSAYWNETSMITSQNSENRMYEVSERSTTRREKRDMEFLKITSQSNNNPQAPRFLNNSTWKNFIKNLIFYENTPQIPNYVYVKFMADKKRSHTGTYGQYIENDDLFPSSEIDRVDPNNIQPKRNKSYSEVIVPLLRFPKKDGLLLEYDMEDNFKAGDFIDTSIEGKNTNGNAYFAQQSVRYVDIMGRADLYQFKMFYRTKNDFTLAQIRELTKAPIVPTDTESQILLSGNKCIALDKDCREALSFNFQINLIDKDVEFLTFPNLFGEKKGRLKLLLYNKTLGMFDQTINLADGAIVKDDVAYSLTNDETNNQITISIETPQGVNLSEVNSLIWYDDDNGVRDIYLVSNVDTLPNNEKLKNRYIYPVFTD